MCAKPILLLSLGAVLHAASPARADEIRTPATDARAPSASLPSELTGLFLGEDLEAVRGRLERDGWRLRSRFFVRRGIPLVTVTARTQGSVVDLRKLKLHFHAGRLVGIAAYYRRDDEMRIHAYRALCRGHEDTSRHDHLVSCVDRARTRILEASQGKVQLIDLAAALATRLITPEKVERRLRKSRERRRREELAQPGRP
jgi:hypothetical protein